jgi:molybdopterin-binding protein
MPISARNQLEGNVAEVTLGDIVAQVLVRIGKKNQVESIITRRSAGELAPKKGDKVTVVIKSKSCCKRTERRIELDRSGYHFRGCPIRD